MSEETPAAASWNDQVIEQFRAGAPRIADMFDRSALILLHTRGARSGRERLSPLAYLTDGDRYVVIASAAGRPEHPAWYHNLVANPRVRGEIWVGDAIEAFDAVAEPAEGEERERLWADVTAKVPAFADYQQQTTRTIPVVTLRRLAD